METNLTKLLNQVKLNYLKNKSRVMKNGQKSLARRIKRGHARICKNGVETRTKRGNWIKA